MKDLQVEGPAPGRAGGRQKSSGHPKFHPSTGRSGAGPPSTPLSRPDRPPPRFAPLRRALGSHWLDAARFAESHGFEYDKPRENAWRYRDYVIQSLNDDKPYDLFVKEQIAGDALEPATHDGIVATGFLVAGPYDEAGNTSVSALLKARIREEELEEMIAAVGQTFL